MVRYLSLFSGVEMASLAWRPLGWELVACAEVDPFASAVIAHYHPSVPNIGDVSEVADEQIKALGAIDLVIGGFPCQEGSLADNRGGLKNTDGTLTRSGLFFDAMRLVRAADPRWLVIENVPGLYSSNEGRDFGDVLGEIVGCSFDIPSDGWQNSGAATGPRGNVCWRCLDAQYAGLAQRRERVFFVADFRARADTEAVFPLLESMPRDTPACVAARQRPAKWATGRARRKGIWEQIADAFRQGAGARTASIAGALAGSDGKAGADATDAEAGRLIPSVAPPLLAHGNTTGGHRQPGMDVDTCESLIPMTFNLRGRDGGSQVEVDPDGLVNMRAASGGSSRSYIAAYGSDTTGPRDVALALNAGGQRRTDFETETLIAHTLTGVGFDGSEDGTGRGTPIIPLMATGCHGSNSAGIGQPGDPAMTLDCKGVQAIAFNARQDPDCSGEISQPLDTDGSSVGIAFDTTQITSAVNRSNPQPGDPCHALSSEGHPPAYATQYAVRRLLPVECERLMGVPDNYTLIPYPPAWAKKYPDRVKYAADGNRYKALGNGFAVPVIRWIGQRIEMVEAIK